MPTFQIKLHRIPRKLSPLIGSKKLTRTHNKNLLSIVTPTPIISSYDFLMYLHTAHKNILEGNNLHQPQKQSTRFFFFQKFANTRETHALRNVDERKHTYWLNLSAGCWSTIDGIMVKKADKIHNVEWENMHLESVRWGEKKKTTLQK